MSIPFNLNVQPQPNILHPDPHLGTLSAQFACNESKLAIWLICPGLALAGNPGLADAADDNDARLRFRLPELASPVRLLDRERWKGEGWIWGEDSVEETEEARRWRCIAVGSMSGRFARRPNSERTVGSVGDVS